MLAREYCHDFSVIPSALRTDQNWRVAPARPILVQRAEGEGDRDDNEFAKVHSRD